MQFSRNPLAHYAFCAQARGVVVVFYQKLHLRPFHHFDNNVNKQVTIIFRQKLHLGPFHQFDSNVNKQVTVIESKIFSTDKTTY